jgi:hypothetical protein
MDELQELGEAYRLHFKSNLGKDMLTRMDALYIGKLQDATKAGKDESWGLLREAAGIDLIRAEFKKMQTIDKRGAGRQ